MVGVVVEVECIGMEAGAAAAVGMDDSSFMDGVGCICR